MFLQSNYKKQNIDLKQQPYICCVFRREHTQTTFKGPLLFLEIISYPVSFSYNQMHKMNECIKNHQILIFYQVNNYLDKYCVFA